MRCGRTPEYGITTRRLYEAETARVGPDHLPVVLETIDDNPLRSADFHPAVNHRQRSRSRKVHTWYYTERAKRTRCGPARFRLYIAGLRKSAHITSRSRPRPREQPRFWMRRVGVTSNESMNVTKRSAGNATDTPPSLRQRGIIAELARADRRKLQDRHSIQEGRQSFLSMHAMLHHGKDIPPLTLMTAPDI